MSTDPLNPDLIKQTVADVQEAMQALAGLAISDNGSAEVAARCLYAATADAVMRLKAAAEQRPDVFRAFSATVSTWPVLACPKRSFTGEYFEILNQLEVGTKSTLNVTPSAKWEIDTPGSQWAGKLRIWIDATRKAVCDVRAMGAQSGAIPQEHLDAEALPPFSKASADQWFNWGVKNKFFPENIEEHADWKQVDKYTSIPKQGGKRAYILSKIKQSLSAMAPVTS